MIPSKLLKIIDRISLERPLRRPFGVGRESTGNAKINARADLSERMKKVLKERKGAMLAKLSGPDRSPVAVVAAEEGVSTATLYNGGKQARREDRLLPDQKDSRESWSA